MDVITETALEALIQRATDPRNKSVDNAAVDAFCGLIKKMPGSSYVACKLLVTKIQSENEWEAVQALCLLDTCMRNCGQSFQCEVGKFRFLNEMIKLVSPRFLANRTSPKVRDTVLGLLRAWTVSYPQEQKIKEAYEMLKKQGVEPTTPKVTQSTPSKVAPQQTKPSKVIDGEFEKKLQKLLSSKNAEDLDAANRMIKVRVLEAERLSSDIERIRNSVMLFNELLDSRQTSEGTADDFQLLTDLHDECEKLKSTVYRLAAETQDSETLADVLNLSEDMQQAFMKYEQITKSSQPSTKEASNLSSLLDLSSPVGNALPIVPLQPTTSEFKDDLLSTLDQQLNVDVPASLSNASTSKGDEIDQLGALFADLSVPVSSKNIVSSIRNQTPQSVVPSEKSSKQKALDELDVLGESFLMKCKNDLEKTRLADTAKQSDDECIGDISAESIDDDLLTDAVPEKITEPVVISQNNIKPINGDGGSNIVQVKPLTDVSVTLDSIRPSNISPIKILDSSNGISVVLHIARDTPRPDVTVYVVTTTSTSAVPITDYHFQVVVPKGCKFKLQSPSTHSLPAHSPFLPPSAITQIMLIANPSCIKINLTCLLSFTMEDETVTEVGEVADLPTQPLET